MIIIIIAYGSLFAGLICLAAAEVIRGGTSAASPKSKVGDSCNSSLPLLVLNPKLIFS